jgi:hypothetical protein
MNCIRGDPAGEVRFDRPRWVISRSLALAAVAWIVAAIIVALNVKLLFETFFG